MIAKKTKMNAIQIHGNCDFAYLKLYNYLVIQSIPLSQPFPPRENVAEQNIDFYIIDGKNPGSGEGYNYGEINNLNIEKKFLVAGGISEKNIGEIFEIFKDNQYFCGVDIASGVDNGDNICLEKVEYIVNLIK
ncbi:MAG: hypothetical protein Q9M97_04915 [Candidatus Gracilibacteria bacterium]|nr:hypothetical protein [Candidatus Gracilibacteria bacterium]